MSDLRPFILLPLVLHKATVALFPPPWAYTPESCYPITTLYRDSWIRGEPPLTLGHVIFIPTGDLEPPPDAAMRHFDNGYTVPHPADPEAEQDQ